MISTLWASKFHTRWYYHYWWAWLSILKLLKVTSFQYLFNTSKKKYGEGWSSFFYIYMNIKVFTSWHYCFDGSDQKCPKYPKYEFGNIFSISWEKYVATAFLFCCDAKHSDILWMSSHLHCYLLLSHCYIVTYFVKKVWLPGWIFYSIPFSNNS